MTVQEYYDNADEFPSLKLLIEFLVNEKKVLKMTDTTEQLNHYLQDKFAVAMNNYLEVYNGKRNLEINKKL